MKGTADLHLHTTASDGTLSPRGLVALAESEGISVIAITDHDTVSGLAEAKEHLPKGMTLIDGVEFSCISDTDPPFLFHLLGYGIDPESTSVKDVVDFGYSERLRKHDRRCEYLKTVKNIVFTDEENAFLATRPAVGKLHIAEVLVTRGLASSPREAIDKYMSSPDFPEGSLPSRMAIDGIVGAGGIPVYAHPLGGECEVRVSRDECERRVKILKNMGVMGLECYYSRYSEEDEAFLLSLADKYGLWVSGGSDFHGKNKTVSIGCLSDTGRKINANLLTVLTNVM